MSYWTAKPSLLHSEQHNGHSSTNDNSLQWTASNRQLPSAPKRVNKTKMASVESFLMVYCFPLQFTIGVIGNTVNLIVLLDKRMRSKTNVLLAVMAFADILFLVFMLPHSLMYYPNLIRHQELRLFFVYASQHFAGIINMCSFISAWVIVLVSVERMTAVLCPLKARYFWNYKTLRIFIGCVLIASILVSMHSHITHKVTILIRNETISNATTGEIRIVGKKVLRSIVRDGMESYWRVATLLDAFVIVFVPVVIVIVTNTLIVCALQKRKLMDEESAANSKTEQNGLNSSVNHARNQRRATFIVFIIASTFTVCQTPSALVHICEIIWPVIGQLSEFRTAATLTNSLVVTGKTTNLFLFCMWSAHFRKNLCRIMTAKFNRIRTKSKRHWKPDFDALRVRSKARRNHSQPVLPTSGGKRSLNSLKRMPSLHTRHSSLPASVDSRENTQLESEQEGLLGTESEGNVDRTHP